MPLQNNNHSLLKSLSISFQSYSIQTHEQDTKHFPKGATNLLYSSDRLQQAYLRRVLMIHLHFLKLLSSEGSVEETLIKMSWVQRQYQVPDLKRIYTHLVLIVSEASTTNIQILFHKVPLLMKFLVCSLQILTIHFPKMR